MKSQKSKSPSIRSPLKVSKASLSRLTSLIEVSDSSSAQESNATEGIGLNQCKSGFKAIENYNPLRVSVDRISEQEVESLIDSSSLNASLISSERTL